MESFNQKITQELDVKSEVSDEAFQTISDRSDDESLSSSAHANAKRSSEDEQDSSSDSGANGSPLPPRKRAKTQEEKEQRRVERIMRNRQAAHASREKKRKHLETLESRCSQLETENMKMKQSMARQDELKARLAQLEAVIKLAKTSGNISDLDSVAAVVPECDSTYLCDTVAGTVAGTTTSASSPAADVETGSNFSGSPAPSLEEDCASPDAFFLKNEELFAPNSPEKVHDQGFEDPFGIMNLSFESNPAYTENPAYFEGSSKSRHPAALTPLSNELANAPIEY